MQDGCCDDAAKYFRLPNELDKHRVPVNVRLPFLPLWPLVGVLWSSTFRWHKKRKEMHFTTFHLCLEFVVVSSCTNPIRIFAMDWMHRHINTHTQMSYGISIFGLFIQLVFDYLSAGQNENYQKENTNDFQSCRQLCGVTPLKRRLRVISGWNRLVSWTQAVYRYCYLERFLSYGCHDGGRGGSYFLVKVCWRWLFKRCSQKRGLNPLWLGMPKKKTC